MADSPKKRKKGAKAEPSNHAVPASASSPSDSSESSQDSNTPRPILSNAALVVIEAGTPPVEAEGIEKVLFVAGHGMSWYFRALSLSTFLISFHLASMAPIQSYSGHIGTIELPLPEKSAILKWRSESEWVRREQNQASHTSRQNTGRWQTRRNQIQLCESSSKGGCSE